MSAVTIRDGQWVAVHVRSNAEKHVAIGLRERHYDQFLPTYRVQRHWKDRNVVLEVPLFPGYLFCRWDGSNPRRIVEIPGVLQIVGLGRVPVPVDEAEVAAIRRIVESGLPCKSWTLLRAGTRVRLVDGPLRGLEGILESTNSVNHVVVNVNLLKRAVAVRVHPSEVSVCTDPPYRLAS